MLKHCHRLYLFRSFDRSFSFGSASSLCANATSVRKWQGATSLCFTASSRRKRRCTKKQKSPVSPDAPLEHTGNQALLPVSRFVFVVLFSFAVDLHRKPESTSLLLLLLSTPYCAPCSSRMPLTMLSPMPDPSFGPHMCLDVPL